MSYMLLNSIFVIFVLFYIAMIELPSEKYIKTMILRMITKNYILRCLIKLVKTKSIL